MAEFVCNEAESFLVLNEFRGAIGPWDSRSDRLLLIGWTFSISDLLKIGFDV
jgi:hypothetical protein